MESFFSRRELLQSGAWTIGAAGTLALAQPDAAKGAVGGGSWPGFKHCLNTSTIRGQRPSLAEVVGIAAKAGYDAIEPWIGEIEAFVREGGSLEDLRKRIADAGLTVESAIGFAPWIVDDPERRRQALAQARREMEMLRSVGGKRIAAPPAGATDAPEVPLLEAAARYRALLDVGAEMGVVPQVEVWGFSKNLRRLGDTMFVALESGHGDACLLPDIYHLYKGGSDFLGLRLVAGGAMHVFHVNDYPAVPPREAIRDADRVYVGDGVAPMDQILRTLRDIGFRGYLSLELFNPTYWEQDPLEVARTGLEKTKMAVAKALE